MDPSLQQEINRLNQEKQAMREEFEERAKEPHNAIETPEAIKSAVLKLVPDAITQLRSLLVHAESDSTRASLAKYIIDVGLGKKKMEDTTESEVEKLLKDIAKVDAS